MIGGGSSGEHCAGELSDGGLEVALVEPDLVGGECSYWACMPSKWLLRPGELIEAARRVPGAREAITGELDSGEALKVRDQVVSGYSDAGQVRWLDGKGIDLLRGTGRITGRGKVQVGDETYGAQHIVVASGSDPLIPPIPGLAELDGIWTNREATGMKSVPQRLFALSFNGGKDLRGDRLLVATGRSPRVDGIGLETVGVEPRKEGIEVDSRTRAAEGVWAIGDVTGIWPAVSELLGGIPRGRRRASGKAARLTR